MFMWALFTPRVPCVRPRATRARAMRGRARATFMRACNMRVSCVRARMHVCVCVRVVHRRVFVRTHALAGHTKNNLIFCDNRALPCAKIL